MFNLSTSTRKERVTHKTTRLIPEQGDRERRQRGGGAGHGAQAECRSLQQHVG